MKISVVIPIYNTEHYLSRCLDSVINQTYENLEIICVNDGSTDNSLDVLKDYQKRDSRIHIIDKPHVGAASARKAGVQEATGEYIGYVDSDDYIEKDMYEIMISHAQNEKVDMVTCGCFLEGNYVTVLLDSVDGGLYPKDRMSYLRENNIYRRGSRERGVSGSLCRKLFKSDLLKKVQMDIPEQITIAEDGVCLFSFLLQCSSAYVLRKPLYHWVIRENSVTHLSPEKNNDYLVKVNHAYNYLTTLYSHPDFTERMREQVEIFIVELLFLGINKRMGFKNRNMIWIDPCWMDKIPVDSRIVLYGGGELGEKYKKQLLHSRPDVSLVGCVDPQYKKLTNDYMEVCEPDRLSGWDYDYVVITIKDKGKALSVKSELMESGINESKIIWQEQPELYWKYIEAEGLNCGMD